MDNRKEPCVSCNRNGVFIGCRSKKPEINHMVYGGVLPQNRYGHTYLEESGDRQRETRLCQHPAYFPVYKGVMANSRATYPLSGKHESFTSDMQSDENM